MSATDTSRPRSRVRVPSLRSLSAGMCWRGLRSRSHRWRRDSVDDDLPFVWERAAGRVPLLPVLHGAPDGTVGSLRAGGAQDRHRPVLRPRRLHRGLGRADPEDIGARVRPYHAARQEIERARRKREEYARRRTEARSLVTRPGEPLTPRRSRPLPGWPLAIERLFGKCEPWSIGVEWQSERATIRSAALGEPQRASCGVASPSLTSRARSSLSQRRRSECDRPAPLGRRLLISPLTSERPALGAALGRPGRRRPGRDRAGRSRDEADGAIATVAGPDAIAEADEAIV